MNKEIKIRLIGLCIMIFFFSIAFFLSGDWRKECHNEDCSAYSPNPVWEIDLIKQCNESESLCYIPLDSSLALGLIGIIGFMIAFAPIRWTERGGQK